MMYNQGCEQSPCTMLDLSCNVYTRIELRKLLTSHTTMSDITTYVVAGCSTITFPASIFSLLFYGKLFPSEEGMEICRDECDPRERCVWWVLHEGAAQESFFFGGSKKNWDVFRKLGWYLMKNQSRRKSIKTYLSSLVLEDTDTKVS